METKMIKVPFDVELAKKITEKSVDGRIVTRDGRSARVICFDAHCEDNIVALVDDSLGIESTFNYLNDGKFYIGDEKECDLFIEIPEYMTFKDGDVLTYRPNVDRWCIFIYKGNDIGLMHNYVTYDCDSRGNNVLTFGKSSYNSTLCESSTEEEKQKLIDALKASKDQRAKECLKKLGIEVKQEYEFKPFDKVLVRDYSHGAWSADFYLFMLNERYKCVGYIWKQCIPYNEQTAHLLGTTQNYE